MLDGLLGAPFSLAVYALSSTTVLADTLDLLLRLLVRKAQGPVEPGRDGSAEMSVPLHVGHFTPYQMRLHLRPFAVVASVRNLSAGAERFAAGMGRFRDNLWVIDDASTDDTVAHLQRLGIRHVCGASNQKKPSALRQLLARLPPEINTIVVIDPDIEFDDGEAAGITHLEQVLFEFQRSGMAAVCPRIVVRPDGWWGDFQYLEYTIALQIARKGLGAHALTSGASIYRRDALEKALTLHSLSVYAEDLSTALILLARGESVYYDGRARVSTEGKRSLRGLLSQRVGWAFGLIQVYLRDFRTILQAASARPFLAYHLLVYTGLLGLVFHPVRVIGFGLLGMSLLNGVDDALGWSFIPDNRWTSPLNFGLAYLQCTILVGVQALIVSTRADWRRTARVVPFYFFYALLQVVPTTVGYLNWIALLLLGRRVYRDHYEDDEALIRRQMVHSS